MGDKDETRLLDSTFRHRLYAVRMSRGLTQAEAAETCHMTRSQWSDLERIEGDRLPNVIHFVNICLGMGCSADWLLDLDDKDVYGVPRMRRV